VAWFFETTVRDVDRPKAHPTPETEAAYNLVRAALTAECQQLPRDNPLWNVGPVEMINGYDLPAFEPRVVTVRDRPIPLPEIISTPIGYLVSNKVRDEIERIEPGRHLFLSTVLEFDSGRREVDRWSYLVIRGRTDCIAIEACTRVQKKTFDPDMPNFFRYYPESHPDTKLAVRRSCVAGRAIWYDYRIDRRFISDEFAEFIQNEEIRGWDLMTWDRPNRVLEVD
jgi:hypothetical protein